MEDLEKLLQGFIDRADICAEDTRDIQMVQVITFMAQVGIIKDLSYQKFITLLAQLKKVIPNG